MAKEKSSLIVNIRNKRASFEYQFLEEFTAGVVLTGSEIKSVRLGGVSLAESYCHINRGELYVKGLRIAPYEQAGRFNHDPLRERKLLLHKRELTKLENKLKDKGLTVIVKRIFVNNRGLCKIDVALAKGKKLYDKRQDIKSKDVKREMDRNLI